MRLNLNLIIPTVILSASLMATPGHAQTSEYILHSGDQDTFTVVQNGAIVRQWGLAPGTDRYQYPLAVRDTIRTMAADEGDSGAEYDLNGNDLGARYVHPPGPSRSWDGTTDGEFNYSIDTGGRIYQFDLDWSNPVLLFSVGGLGALTYDPENDSLWVGTFSGSTELTEYDMAGNVLSSFPTGHTKNMAVALDHADGTLWIHDRNRQGTLEQWSRDGQLLATVAVPGLDSQNALAGEFAFGSSGGLIADIEGRCPGRLTLTVQGATPGGRVAVVYGTNAGSYMNPGPPCQGITLGLRPPFLPGSPRLITANGQGQAIFSANAPANLCGRGLLQVVDIDSCEVSNVVNF